MKPAIHTKCGSHLIADLGSVGLYINSNGTWGYDEEPEIVNAYCMECGQEVNPDEVRRSK